MQCKLPVAIIAEQNYHLTIWTGSVNQRRRLIKVKRPTKDEYYINIAKAVSARSTCIRRQYGAIIVKDDVIISTGYNGSPRGYENCCDTCECWREANDIPHGEQYEKCVSIHAEQNAIINADRSKMLGATMYLYGEENCVEINAVPCLICNRMIHNAGIADVINMDSLEPYDY